VITFLADHNIEGHAALLWSALVTEGWLELLPLHLITFTDANLPFTSTDRDVWRFAQASQFVLLTGNRNMQGDDSLEETIREENQPTSLPVVTISNVYRMMERTYREQCAARLVEICLYLDDYRGAGRLFIP